MNKAGKKVLVTLLIAAVAIVFTFVLSLTGSFEDFELSTLRARVRAKGRSFPGSESPGVKVPGICIIDIDDRSLLPPEQEGLGRFQDWTREYYAQVIGLIEAANPAAIAFDIHFFEPAGNPDFPRISRTLLEETEKTEELTSYLAAHDEDTLFAKALSKTDDVILGISAVDASSTDQLRQEQVLANPFDKLALTLSKQARRQIYLFSGFHPPIKPLTENSHMLGHTIMHPEDEVIWRIPLIIQGEYRGPNDALAFPAISLAAVATAKGVPIEEITFDPEVGIYLGRRFLIPTTPNAELVLNYLGPSGQSEEGSFRYFSFADLQYLAIRDDMTAREKAGQIYDNFHNQVVLIGGTAGSLFDFISSPYSNAYPGVEIHATAIANMLSGNYLTRLDSTLSILLFIALTLLVCFLVSYLRWWLAAPIVVVLLIGYVLAAFWLFNTQNIWLELVRPGIGMVAGLLAVVGYHYVFEQRSKRKIKNTFQHYVSPAVVEQMIDNPELMKLGGDKRELTVIFTDVKGFTSISEMMEPAALVKLMNDYLTPMADIIFEQNGTVDKFIGDAVMGLFGAPIPLKHHADAACHAALEMISRLKKLNVDWAKLGRPELAMRIGVNSGQMIVGNMGSRSRFDYTVMGDNVNLGARLEPLNKVFDTSIIISEFTRKRLVDSFILRNLGSFRVKGKNEPVVCYELIGLGTPDDRTADLLERFAGGMSLFNKADFKGAFEYFKDLTADFPEDGPSKSYLTQVRALYANPPGDDWEPIHTMLAK